MIRYRKQIKLAKSPNGEWRIESDRGDRYETFKIENNSTPWTAWWDMNVHNDLREWQKDIGRMFANKWEDLTPYVVFKKGHGYNQNHDVFLAHSEKENIWLMMTAEDMWIVPTNYGEFHIAKEDSLGSVIEQDTRQTIYNLLDNL